MLLLCICDFLKSILRNKCLIFDTVHPRTLYLRQQGREDPWLFFEDKRGPRAKTFEKHRYRHLFYFVQYIILTYSMVQSPSWEANWFAASQEIPRISRNPNVHYRTHKHPPPVFILGQPNPVHILTSHLLEIHPNIIHLSTPRSPQWSPSLRFPQQDPIHPPLLTHTRHMPSPLRNTVTDNYFTSFNT